MCVEGWAYGCKFGPRTTGGGRTRLPIFLNFRQNFPKVTRDEKKKKKEKNSLNQICKLILSPNPLEFNLEFNLELLLK